MYCFSMYFYGSNPGHPGEHPFWNLGPLFEQNRFGITWQCCISNFKQLNLVILEEFLKYILSIQDPWDKIIVKKKMVKNH